MSNQAVGAVYQSIIEEVINSSRVDFEESGVDDSVLEELRQGWQLKLSQLDVARFPWDPKPEPSPPAPAEPQAPTPSAQAYNQAPFSPQQLSLPGAPGGAGASAQHGIKQEPGALKQEGLKQEPGLQPNTLAAFANYSNLDDKNSVAASRAAQQLQMQYGMRAAGSINAIQDRIEQQQQQQQQQTELSPDPQSVQSEQGAVGNEQQGQPPVPANEQARASSAPGSAVGQTDGVDEEGGGEHFEGVLTQRGADGNLQELDRVEIDRMLHKQIASKGKAMEDGGLMLPLKRAAEHAMAPAQPAKRAAKSGMGFDGVGDEDDLDDDEDAINSDLDDSDDDREDEVDDEGLGHIMLCMYDKVQRVKNKWKCTLKDGVLTVNGKEYIFHKATGEYEW